MTSSSTSSSPGADPLVGQLVDGKYRIEKVLGRGGMGAVYRATHLGTERTVALKVLSSRLVGQAESVERFAREAKAAGQLRHPNVVNVTDFGFWEREESPLAYLVMEYLDGVSLGDVLKEEKKLPLAWIVDILEQVCVAMEKAHARGIIHRDLKPDNIWLEPNDLGGYTVKVLDFGLARLAAPSETSEEETTTVILGASDPAGPGIEVRAPERTDGDGSPSGAPASDLTTAGSVLGTPHYMSPEQCLGQPLDHRADIYSLGVIAYEMLTGDRPFTGSTTTELIRKQVNDSPPAAHEKRSSVPRAVGELVERAMAKRPEDRPASAAGFASALRARSEGLGATLRRAFLLYTEHFGTFLLISILAYVPSVFSTIHEAGLEISASSFATSLLFGFAAFLITFSVSVGLIVPSVANLLVRPLSPIRVRAATRKLLDRFRPFASATVRFYARLLAVLLAMSLLVGIAIGLAQAGASAPPSHQPAPETTEAYRAGEDFGRNLAQRPEMKIVVGVVLVVLALLLVASVVWLVRSAQKLVGSLLYGPAVIMEDLSGKGAIVRSRELARRVGKSLFGWTALLAVWFGLFELLDGLLLHSGAGRLSGLGTAAWIAATVALSILINPIVIAGLALLYFKARQMEGETLAEILKDYEKDLPLQEYRRSLVIPSHFSSGPPRLL
ncbi:MAG TPA: serine/threonine-protein kinase [Thermoanaerobaculia bacterium]|nr:serine/threonine-protein kinase [Thermoanaerobaculia bacterium]